MELVDVLIGLGAQLGLQDAGDGGGTALIWASSGYRGHTEIAVALINSGARLDLHNAGGDTAAALIAASALAATRRSQWRYDGRHRGPISWACMMTWATLRWWLRLLTIVVV